MGLPGSRTILIYLAFPLLNISLGDGYVLKLGDNALSRDLFPSDYHCLGDNENRPIKWLPVEAIAQKNYSRASDVVTSWQCRRHYRRRWYFKSYLSVVVRSFLVGAHDARPTTFCGYWSIRDGELHPRGVPLASTDELPWSVVFCANFMLGDAG